MARKYLTQILDEINEDPKKLEDYKNESALRLLFEYSFDPELKFDLPAGDPPYKEATEPMGMTPTNIYQELRKFEKFTKKKDLNPLIRERVFITLLEGLHPKEAKLVLAIKDQKLTKLYKKITHKRVYDAGFITIEPPKRATSAKKKGQTKNSQPKNQKEKK